MCNIYIITNNYFIKIIIIFWFDNENICDKWFIFSKKTWLYKNYYILKSTYNLILSINMKILNKTILPMAFESIKYIKKYKNDKIY